MIQKIGLLNFNTHNYSINNAQKHTTNTFKQNIQYNNTQNLQGVPYSYISFKGIENTDSIRFNKKAKILLEHAKTIALNYNHTEITPYHVIQAAIEENESSIKALMEKPELYNDEEQSTLHNMVNTFAKKDVILNPDELEYFLDETEVLKEENLKMLDTLPNNTSENKDLSISDDLKAKLKELNGQEINSYALLGVAFNTIIGQGTYYPSSYIEAFHSLALFKNDDEVYKHYLEAFDKKAIEVWNKLALGSSLFVISKNEEDKNRMVASIVNTLSEPKHGNFTPDNTYVYSINPESSPQTLIKEIGNISECNPDKKLLFMIDMDDLILQTLSQKNNVFTYSPELFEIANLAKNNVKIMFLQNSSSYYPFMQEDEIKKAFSKYINYHIPPVQSYEVSGILKKNKELLKDVSKPFQKDAREKTIVLAEKLEGAFPDKAVDLMKRISEYYGDDVKSITSKDVEEFAYIAGDLFNNDSDETPIIYNTGKTLATYYGKETTKKDIENIVKQIKTGRIGTQGMVIYSKDDEAGAGKKYTAEVIAGEAKVPFLELDSADFATSDYDYESRTKTTPADQMTKIFNDIKLAAKQNPYKTAILYINNFDEFAFSGQYISGYKQAKAQLSREMEKAINEDVNILVMGSTIEEYSPYIPMVIKDFSQNIIVDSPAYNKKSRKEVLENIIAKQKLPLSYKTKEQKAELIDKLVKITEYFSYVEIKNLVNKTSQIMLERDKKRASIGEFIEAYLQLATGRTSNPEMPSYNKEATTSHECGHATNLEVMNNIYRTKGKPWFTSRDVNFITLDPRGTFLGAVFEGKTENSDYPFEAMFADIVCAYGGHSCEKEFFDMDGSAGISQDLAQATSAAKRGVEYFGLGYHTGKISNSSKIPSGILNENIYKDTEVILTNAQIVSDLITEAYKDFNVWFTQKYSKLIGSNNCMIDGDDFRKSLNNWIASQSEVVKEELKIVEDIILDIIKSTKNGKIYYHTKKLAK